MAALAKASGQAQGETCLEPPVQRSKFRRFEPRLAFRGLREGPGADDQDSVLLVQGITGPRFAGECSNDVSEVFPSGVVDTDEGLGGDGVEEHHHAYCRLAEIPAALRRVTSFHDENRRVVDGGVPDGAVQIVDRDNGEVACLAE